MTENAPHVANSDAPSKEPIFCGLLTQREPIIEVTGLEKSYKTARGELNLFRNLNLHVEQGEMVAIVGQSGRGKKLTFAHSGRA